MRPSRLASLLALAAFALPATPAAAQDPQQPTTPRRIATKSAPPFAIRSDDGTDWSGLSIELFEDVAASLGWKEGVDWTWVEIDDLQQLLGEVTSGSADAAVAALTITAEREQSFDFGHAFLDSGLGIATVTSPRSSVWTIVQNVASWNLLRAIGALGVVLLVCGALVWWFERRRNPEQFGGTTLEGLGNGFWWSAVTMTTVGYGDKAPVTAPGRFVALIWMFASIIVISSYTASIASALTVDRLASQIQGPEDLPGARVGSVSESTSAAWLDEHRIAFRGFQDVSSALDALAAGDLEAVVYDAPIMQYYAKSSSDGQPIEVLPDVLRQQRYAIGFPTGSELRESVNRVMLDVLDRPDWEQTRSRYLGQ